MNAKNVIIAVVVVAILGVGGWLVFAGGDDDNTTPTTANTGTDSQSTTDTNNTNRSSNAPNNTGSNAASTDEVEIENFAFSPATITVKKGTTVTWTNKDSTAHTVTADSGGGLNSELLERGESYSFTFNEVGRFAYHCAPHPNMTGTVIVTD